MPYDSTTTENHLFLVPSRQEAVPEYSARWVQRPVFVDTLEVAKAKVLFIYWLFINPEFLVANPKMVSKPKVAKPSGHCTYLLQPFSLVLSETPCPAGQNQIFISLSMLCKLGLLTCFNNCRTTKEKSPNQRIILFSFYCFSNPVLPYRLPNEIVQKHVS